MDVNVAIAANIERPSDKLSHEILLSGDCHGDFHRLANQNVRNHCRGMYPSHVIILGDFGLIWGPEGNAQEVYWTKWLNDKPWITLAVSGNHCNYERIYQLPLVDLYGGKAYKVSDKVYILQHGNVYTIEGKTFFNFGGGLSIDKQWRKNRISWWEEEIPTQADFMRAEENRNESKGKGISNKRVMSNESRGYEGKGHKDGCHIWGDPGHWKKVCPVGKGWAHSRSRSEPGPEMGQIENYGKGRDSSVDKRRPALPPGVKI